MNKHTYIHLFVSDIKSIGNTTDRREKKDRNMKKLQNRYIVHMKTSYSTTTEQTITQHMLH